MPKRIYGDGVRTCIVENCDGPFWNRGMCPKHYARWRTHGHTNDPVSRRQKCSVEDCDVLSRRHGFCQTHDTRFKKYGDPNFVKVIMDPKKRFMSYVNQSDECWMWTGVRHPTRGYGRFYISGHYMQAHRWSYEHFVGPIPSGLHIDHLCRVRACVNPAHLEAVTQTENNRRAAAFKAQTLVKTT